MASRDLSPTITGATPESAATDVRAGDLVISRNGEFGWVERFGGPLTSPWALVRNIDGFKQSFGLAGLRHPDAERDVEVFCALTSQAAE